VVTRLDAEAWKPLPSPPSTAAAVPPSLFDNKGSHPWSAVTAALASAIGTPACRCWWPTNCARAAERSHLLLDGRRVRPPRADAQWRSVVATGRRPQSAEEDTVTRLPLADIRRPWRRPGARARSGAMRLRGGP